jgi:Ser/Thr protein kinase RdoA (MazF antagonist)
MASIPEAHRAAAARALGKAFRGAPVTAITPLTGGRSTALVYRVDAGSRSAVLRIITQRNPLTDPVRQFAAMEAAAAAGVAPGVLYSDAEAGIAITAFINARPWDDLLRTDPAWIARLGACVRRLHDGPAMPVFLDAFQCIEQAVLGIGQAGATLPPLFRMWLDQFQTVRQALAPHCVLGPSHNDLNPGNLLLDDERFWIVDWESAWQNDPMFDVATMLHWFGFAGASEAALLRGYFGAEPSALQLAKLELMRQVVSTYYAVVFLLIPMQRGELPPPLDVDPASLESFAEARRGMRDRRLPLATPADHVRFSLIMVHEAMRRMETPEYQVAFRMIEER